MSKCSRCGSSDIIESFETMTTRKPHKLNYYFQKQPDYEKAFDILMEYWDFIPDEEKDSVYYRLTEYARV